MFLLDGKAYFSQPGPRLVDSLEILAHALHPDVHPLPPGLRAAERVDVRAPGFAVWDAYASKRIAGGVDVFGALDNLADNQDPNTDRLLPAGTPVTVVVAEWMSVIFAVPLCTVQVP